ncbi:ZN638 protein, partial [Halcyon senegalensis]|nr:ZN638 protein [Halcyon senegalensis]
MYSFLRQYPYNMGEHTLTCTLSPNAEAAEAEAGKKEPKKEEPSKASPGLTKYPEGSGAVRTAAADAPVEPSVARKGPAPISPVQTEPSEARLERALGEAVARPAESAAGKADPGAEGPEPPAEKAGETLPPPPPPGPQRGQALKGDPPELARAAVTSPSEVEATEEDEELAPPATQAPAPSCPGQAGELPSGCAVKPESGPILEVPPPAPEAASVSPGVARAAGDLNAPENPPPSDAAKNGGELSPTPPTERKPALKTASATEEKPDVSGEVKAEEPVPTVGRATEENAEKLRGQAGAEAEEKAERHVAEPGAAVGSAVGENDEGSSTRGLQNKPPGPARSAGTPRAVALTSSLSLQEPLALSKTLLKAVVSLPDIAKARLPVRRREPPQCAGGEQKPPSKPESRGQAPAEQKSPSKAAAHPPADGDPAGRGDGSGTGRARSSVGAEKGGNGRNSSQQEKDTRVESRPSSKPCQEGESRTPGVKKTPSSTKVSAGGTTKASKSGAGSGVNQKEEEELFPFNLDEFVTVDEVVEEVESPVRTRRNPPRGKRKDAAKTNSSSEPSSKRRKGKSSAARAAESELSFVTLDEIGEEEDVAAQLMGVAGLEALSDPQGLVVVDEVMEEEELLSEAVKDPRSLVTLDELCEQEELGSQKDVPRSLFEERDLKAEPLVTVDEIGEVEELPLNEPTDLSVEDMLKQKEEEEEEEEEEKAAAEDAGDGASFQVPDDPSALVTVDEIQEDNEDNPLVTLDEVNEDEDDFLADFNRLKEELNFVTVDEVGEEDEEEENTSLGKNPNKDEDDEDIVAVTGPEEEEMAAVAGPEEEDIVAVAGPEEMAILGDTSSEETVATSGSKGEEP